MLIIKFATTHLPQKYRHWSFPEAIIVFYQKSGIYLRFLTLIFGVQVQIFINKFVIRTRR